MVLVRFIAALLLSALLTGCADTRYYYQSVSGHLQLMQAARPVGDWLADPQAPDGLKARLALAQQIRAFAVSELKLPDNASYQRYADLQRRAVVWNVVAAPEFSLTLKTWCFPVAGCVGYRGYFNEAEAREQAAALQQTGLEVSVYGVPAYSTLGWLNWAGGDPLLNTFVGLPDAELAQLIFHELAHQVLYVPDDTRFNESFATTVERLGVQRWLAQPGTAGTQREAAEQTKRRQQFRALTLATRSRLAEIYRSNKPLAPDSKGLFAMKTEAMKDFRAAYAELRRGWGGYAGYDAWVAGANNAAFGAQAAYDELVPAFESLFEREGQDWPRFYAEVRRLAALPAPERAKIFQQLTEPRHG